MLDGFIVVMTPQIFEEAMAIVDICNKEVGWFAKVDYNQERMEFRYLSFHILKQEVSGATTDLDAEAVANYPYETRDSPGHNTGWCHSHVNMGVNWSGTDLTTIREIAEAGWCVATVFNKKREMRSAFCTYTEVMGIKQEVMFQDIPTIVKDNLSDQRRKDIEAEIKLKVREKTYGNFHNVGRNRGPKINQPDFHQWSWIKEKYTNPKQKPGWLPKGISPLQKLGYYDWSGTELCADDRPIAERKQKGSKSYIYGHFTDTGRWVEPRYVGEAMITMEAFSAEQLEQEQEFAYGYGVGL